MAFDFPALGFKDYDIDNPFDVPAKPYTVDLSGYVVLDYVPLKGSVTISGYAEIFTSNPATGQFYIDYQDVTQYRMGRGIVKFHAGAANAVVSPVYKGVSTVYWSRWINYLTAHANNDSVSHLSQAEHDKLTAIVGNQTIDQATATAYANAGVVSQVLSWFAKRIQGIIGTTNWYDAIPVSLKSLWEAEWFLIECSFQNPADNQLIVKFECKSNCTIKGAKVFGDVAPTAATVLRIANATTAATYQDISISAATTTTWTAAAGLTMDAGQIGTIAVVGTSGLKTHNFTVAVRVVNR